MRVAFYGVVLATWFALVPHVAADTPWTIPFVQPKQLRIDGAVGEWSGASWKRIGDDARGRAEVALAYDDTSLFIAARVFDDAFVRTAHPSAAEDALVLMLELPTPQPRRAELWLYAGQIGRTRAQVQLLDPSTSRAREAASVQLVEGPGARGESYVLEAAVPWSVLGAADWMFARAALRLHDVDGRDKPREVATSAHPEPLAFERGPLAALAALLEERNLSQAPKLLDVTTKLRASGQAARVIVVGTLVVVASAQGSLEFAELPATHGADVQAAELRDLTGDGLPELTVRVTTRDSGATRKLWLVFDLSAGAPQRLFAAELRRERAGAYAEASLSVANPLPRERAPRILLSSSAGRGVSAGQELGPALTDVVPVPTAWGPWMERVYAWDGARFALRNERPNPAAAPQLTATARASADREAQAVPTAPAAVSGADTAQLVDAYVSARGISKALQPRFVQRANLAEDARLEQIAVYDRECLVVGSGFRGGKDFFYFALPVQSADQVLALFTGDVTGDQRHEIFARVATQASGVTRELLMVYSFHSGGFETLLVAEVGRADAGHAIRNEVRMAPHQGRSALQIRPGTARGWTSASYPYRNESQAGIAPLLLPWTDRERDYCYHGKQLVPCLGSD